VSADGRRVAFTSSFPDLVPGVSPPFGGVYIRDRVAGTTTYASGRPDGSAATGAGESVLSDDGRYVAFQSSDGDLVAGDTNGASDVFRHDLVTGRTVRVSVARDGSQSPVGSSNPAISRDGHLIAFVTAAKLRDRDRNKGRLDVYLRNTAAGSTSLVSVDANGRASSTREETPGLSGNGRYVAFYAPGTSMVTGDPYASTAGIFARDRTASVNTRVSVSTDGRPATFGSTDYPNMSPNGQHVAFQSDATELFDGAPSFTYQAYVREHWAS
jgi:Tol biopolymer transport system component